MACQSYIFDKAWCDLRASRWREATAKCCHHGGEHPERERESEHKHVKIENSS